MENNNIPTLDDLIKESDSLNEKYNPNYKTNIPLLEQVIELINIYPMFRRFLELNGYINECWNPYDIFGQIVHYMKSCYDNQNYNEIKKILEFVDEKMQSKIESINTLAQIGVLEILDIYPDMLDKVLELMPKYSKDIFMKNYSHYLK